MVLTTQPNIVNYVTHPFVYWDNWLGDETLEALEKYCSALELSDGVTIGPNGEPANNSDYRKSQIKMVPASAETGWIFEKFIGIATHINNQYYNYELNGFDYFQYTEYEGEDSKYDYHMDLILGENLPQGMTVPRKLSFSLILSDPSEYEGGELEFWDGGVPRVAEQKKGRILVFPSFLMHRVKPITKGKRRSIVFWAVGPKFK